MLYNQLTQKVKELQKKEKAMQSKDNALNQTEFNELLNACKDGKDKLLVILCSGLGLRAGEIAHLRVSWIDWQGQKINIPSREGDWSPKTESSARSIPFKSMERVKVIVAHYFGINDSLGMSRIAVYKRVQRIAQRTKIQKKVTPHTLRATAAFMFAEAGLSAQALRQVMGWTKLETAEHYIIRSGRAAEREIEESKGKLWV